MSSMRTIIAVVLSVALGAASAFAENVTPADQGLEAGTSLSASYLNIVYLPAKIIVAVVGGIAGGVAGVLTGGDQRAAYGL